MDFLTFLDDIFSTALDEDVGFNVGDACEGIVEAYRVAMPEVPAALKGVGKRVVRKLEKAKKYYGAGDRASAAAKRANELMGKAKTTPGRLERLKSQREKFKAIAKRANRRRFAVKAAGLTALGGVSAAGNLRDIMYIRGQQEYYKKHGKLYKPKFVNDDKIELDNIITETVKRRQAGTVGGIKRWRRTGRPNPMRSIRAKRSARKNRFKRKMAMRRLMNSPKGAQLRRFRSQVSRGRKRKHGRRRRR